MYTSPACVSVVCVACPQPIDSCPRHRFLLGDLTQVVQRLWRVRLRGMCIRVF
ncbi:hypothetical protein PF005_g5341 [Phytophthora fragariae]|uniref:Uncharacterized protein n=1 Tax=Phytophthora fragariae TaxID=53985 RepID=A0A6A4A251_9STRA|nr:hypothetical protein PF003_g27129 [Phytophthora fragariae]KAE8949667.1 hypothetical protein PF009_g779 [Phytophthora fragariae]KAE9021551.1 hypothetical protein PF011_g4908 [Phytophthora fragariae]KAE9091730.1 hypothetical protein PF010_g18076 [Phytophthora fragariae]KAE9108256.1 hypothetical protein PF006_g20917 [Phytophthora fragariae]